MNSPSAIFFDTSFISEAHLEGVKYSLDLAVTKYITEGVYGELQGGYLNDPYDERFSSFFQCMSEKQLRNNIKTISLGRCVKEIGPVDFDQDTIFLKRSSLLCSAYYAWLDCAVNPSVITDPFRHRYNAALYKIRTKGDPDNEMSALLGRLRTQEIGQLERIGFRREGFTATALKRARKKRLKDIKNNTLKITDYELVVTAFLFLCFSRSNVLVLTCDKDLTDIKENLIRSAIEKYTLDRLLTKKLKSLNKCGTLCEKDVRLCLTGEEVREELLNHTFKRMKKDNLSRVFKIGFYDRRDRKIYGGEARIPVWLMDFVLEYRLNFNCYSADKTIEMKYPLNYIMIPSEDLEEIHFKITLRTERLHYGLMSDCEEICSYPRTESDTPAGLTSFVEMAVFDSRNKPDFSNPWINRGFVLFRLGRYDEALKSFDKAIGLQHDSADAWYGKGISLGKLDRHEEAAAALETVIKLKPDYHAAFCSWGGVLLDLAGLRQGADREALLGGAAEKFASAVEINPDIPEALYGWGIALWSLAAMREGTYREILLEEAIEKFAAAAQIKPDMHEALLHWGHTLMYLATLHEGPAREVLLRKATEKYAKTVRIKPDMHEAYYQWGNALEGLATLDEGPAREALLRKATEKYAKTVEIKPDMHEAFYQWGNALGGLATLPETCDRQALLQEATEKFATALEIKPDMHEALFKWGHALRDLVFLSEKPDRRVLLQEAAEKYGKTVNIRPDMFEAIYHWGNALSDLAALHEGPAREELLRKAIEKFAAAAQIKPDMHEALFGWGYALMSIADLREGHEREALLKKAIEKFAEAEEIKSDNLVLCNWGFALVLLAELQEGDNREALLSEAVEKLAKAVKINSEDYDALYNLSNALRVLAYIYKGRQRTETLEAALEKAKRVEDLKLGAGIYSMARVYALLGQGKKALTSLKKAVESDPQYKQIAVVDEDFRSLWEVETFKNIVAT